MSTLDYETPRQSNDARPLLAPALAMFFIGMFGPAFLGAKEIVWMLAAVIFCQAVSVVLGITWASKQNDGLNSIGLERAGLRHSARKVLIGFAIVASITYLTNLATQLLLDRFDLSPNQNHPMLDFTQSGSSLEPTLAVVSAVLVAPAFEEILFRGHFLPLFASLFGRAGATLMTSLLFTILHPWWTMPAIFVLSVMLCVVRWKTNSTWPPMAIHVLFNLTSTVFFVAWAGS